MCLSAAKKPSIAAIMIFILRKMCFFFYRSDRIKRRKKLYWKEISQMTIWIELPSFVLRAKEGRKNQGKEGFIIIKAFKTVTR